MSDENKITASIILSLLKEKYSKDSRQWAIASEVQRKTGWSDRRYDFVAMNCYDSNNYRIEVVEIKVSKADIRHELMESEKHTIIFEEIDYYWLAAPEEIIDMAIIPPKWGVYAVKDGKLVTKRKPLCLHDEYNKKISRPFAASFLRAVINQNLATKLLWDELQKKYKEGYQRGVEDCRWDGQKKVEYDRCVGENRKLRGALCDLGLYGILGRSGDKDKEIERLKEARILLEQLNPKNLEYIVQSLERKAKDLGETMEMLKKLKEDPSAPLISNEESGIIRPT